MKKVTDCDLGGGRYKIWHLRGDGIFEWPQTSVL